MDEKQLQALWDSAAKNQGFKDYNEFKGLMSNNDARKLYFDENNSNLGFKDYSEFESLLGVGKQKEVSPQGSVGTSQTSVEPTQNTRQLGQNIENPNGDLSNPSSVNNGLNPNAVRSAYTNQQLGIDLPGQLQEEYTPEGWAEIPNVKSPEGFPVYGKLDENGNLTSEQLPLNVLRQSEVSLTAEEAAQRNTMTQDELIDRNDINAWKSIKNSFSNIANQIQGADDRLSIFSADVWEKVLGRDIAKAWYESDGRDIDQTRIEAYAELDRLGKEALPTMGIVESVGQGDLAGTAAGIVNGVTSIFGTALVSVPTMGAGLITELVGGTLYDYNSEKAKSKGKTVEQLMKDGEADFWVPAAVGSVAAALEGFGLKGVQQGIMRQLTGTAAKKLASLGLEMNKEGMTEWVQTGLEAYNMSKAQGKSDTDAINDLVGKMFSDEGLESYLQGLAGSGGSIAGGRFLKGIVDKSSRDKVQKSSEQLESVIGDLANNPNPEVKSQLIETAAELSEQIQAERQNSNEVVSRLSDDQRVEMQGLESEMDSVDRSLGEGNLSQATVDFLNNKKDSIQQRMDAIISSAPESTPTTVEPSSDLSPEQVDQGVLAQRKANPEVENLPMGTFEIPDDVYDILDLKDQNQPISSEQKSKAIESLYEKKKELKALKNDPNRSHTIQEIDEIIAGLDADMESISSSPESASISDADVALVKPGEVFQEGVVKSTKINEDGSVDVTMEDGTTITSEIPQVVNQNNTIENESAQETTIEPQAAVENGQVPVESSQVAPVGETSVQTQEVVAPTQATLELEGEAPVVPRDTQAEIESQREQNRRRNPSEFSHEDEYYRYIAEVSDDPDEIATAYSYIQPGEPDYVENAIHEYLGGTGKINQRDIVRALGRNTLSGKQRARWMDRRNSNISLDVMAQELSNQLGMEVTEADILDFISKYDSTKDFTDAQKTDTQRSLEDKYKELTGRNLTAKVARRTVDRINRNMTDKERAELSDVFTELGITYDDILNYENYIEETTRRNAPGVPESANDKKSSRRKNQGNTRVQEDPITEQVVEGVDDQAVEETPAASSSPTPTKTETNSETSKTTPNESSKQKNTTKKDEPKPVQSKPEQKSEDSSDTESEKQAGIGNAAKNEVSKVLRDKYGLGSRETPLSKAQEQSMREARAKIKSGEVDPRDVMDRALAGRPLDDVEQAVLIEYVGQLELDIDALDAQVMSGSDVSSTVFNAINTTRDQRLNELSNTLYALERAGTTLGRALSFRRHSVDTDTSLPSMVARVRKAKGGQQLSSRELEQVRQKNKEIEAKTKQLEKRIVEITDDLTRAKAEIALMAEQKKAALDYQRKKDKNASRKEALEDIQKRRQEAKDALNNSIKQIFGSTSGFAFDPKKAAKIDIQAVEALGKLAKTYFDEALLRAGKINYNSVISNITRDIREAYPNITKEQVDALVSSLDTDDRPTIHQLRAEVADLKAKIRDRNLQGSKEALKKRLDKIDEKIKNKDYKPLPAKFEQYDKEYRQLKRELNKKIHEFNLDVEKAKHEQKVQNIKAVANRIWDNPVFANVTSAIIDKGVDWAAQVIALPRAVMATGDLSAAFRQGIVAIIGNPRTGIQAFKEMHKFAFNEEYYLAYMDAIQDSEMFELAQKSGLSITGAGPNVWATLREEQWTSRLVSAIPGFGKLADFSERGFAGFLNKMRIDLFNTASTLLMDQGVNPVDNPEQFKAAATYINAITGRGPVPAKWEAAFSTMSTALFAPRLITSRLYLLMGGPIYSAIKSGNMNVAKEYIKDMSMFVAFGVTAMGLASLTTGVDIIGDDEEEDLIGEGAADSWTSTDFLNIKYGETRFDIWGGFAQYIRLFSQVGFGQKVTTGGRVKLAEEEEYNVGSYIARFARSKLAPSAALLIDSQILKENYMGEPFDWTDAIANMSSPLVLQETFKGVTGVEGTDFMNEVFKSATGDQPFDKEGNIKFDPIQGLRILVPSFYGFGVNTWDSNSFLNKDVDKEILDVLVSKKLSTMTKRKKDLEIIDINTGEKRELTDEEFKRYTDIWSNHIKESIKPRLDKFSKYSEATAEKEFNKIKAEATRIAKKEISGVSSEDMRIQFDKIGYELTPDQVKDRLKKMEAFKKDNASDYEQMKSDLISEGMSESQAANTVRKQIESDARSYTRDLIIQDFEEGKIKLKQKE